MKKLVVLASLAAAPIVAAVVGAKVLDRQIQSEVPLPERDVQGEFLLKLADHLSSLGYDTTVTYS